ncbi:uncharacterized protein LOC125179458 [Hyalella azteca]|uniref:Uncharacterized protein LOC125179458 n=1 Tax=Hyalella azteca TaxID=294128 RepID=A0A979FVQ4_HYAAZ|nr:uncharacterized protein LOC125179458 [Hyalella azteca]
MAATLHAMALMKGMAVLHAAALMKGMTDLYATTLMKSMTTLHATTMVIILSFGFLHLAAGTASLLVDTAHVSNYSDFLSMRYKMVNPESVMDVVEVLRACECRHLCQASGCQAFSVRSLGYDRFECSVTNVSIYITWPHPERNSVYYIRRDSRDHLGVDNLVYRRLDSLVPDFNATKEACKNVTGFRMVAVRFKEQMPIMLELCLGAKPWSASNCAESKWFFFVDMVKVNGQPMIEGSIHVNDTNLNLEDIQIDHDNDHIFIYAYDKLQDDVFTQSFFPVCQANPFGVNW